jgi:D-alanyl-D-alanine carboxypeptidase (penicillin-binding protein 5/6)
MYKRVIIISILFLSVSLFAKEAINVTAYSAILINASNKKVLYSKNPHVKLAPASTVKIMTALLVLKNISLDKNVTVSAYATSMPPSKIHLKKGEVYKVSDLLKALLLNSGNDASVALAEAVAGTEANFVKMMNDMAKKIGCYNTNFKTSNGLPAKGQYSTAYDLALIVREAVKDKRILDIMEMKNTEIKELNSNRGIRLKNHNKSLWKDTSYLILGKTGYTFKAKQCFAGYVHYDKKRNLIVALLKGRKLWLDLKEVAQKGRHLF